MDIRQAQRQLVEILEASGWDYDDARAFAMGIRAPSTEAGFDAPTGTEIPTEAAELIDRIRAEFAPAREAREAEARETEAQAQAAAERIRAGAYTNADLRAVVRAGLAEPVYDDPESNRPTHIRWVTRSLDNNPYKGVVEG